MRTYYIKFKADGTRDDTVPDFFAAKKGGVDSLLSAGYIAVQDDEYQYYVGNQGQGKNGTGYIRGADGKPTDAPAAEVIITVESTAPVDDTTLALAEAIAQQEERITALEGSK